MNDQKRAVLGAAMTVAGTVPGDGRALERLAREWRVEHRLGPTRVLRFPARGTTCVLSLGDTPPEAAADLGARIRERLPHTTTSVIPFCRGAIAPILRLHDAGHSRREERPRRLQLAPVAMRNDSSRYRTRPATPEVIA